MAGRAFLSPVRRQQLMDQVLNQLQESLARGDFAVGEKLPPEPELMAQFGVGRTTIREAIRVLAHQGMLVVRQGDGTYVRASTPAGGQLVERLQQAHVLEVFEVRRALELEMIRLAALRRDEADLARMRELLERMRASLESKRSRQAFLDADIELHLTIASSTKNQVMIDLYRSFATALREAIAQVITLPGVMEACLSRHELTLEALVRQDAEVAQASRLQYLDRMTGLLKEVLGANQEPAHETIPQEDHRAGRKSQER
jgi:GntR family transcriptional repressor for pyruvate dehydrogenase complex